MLFTTNVRKLTIFATNSFITTLLFFFPLRSIKFLISFYVCVCVCVSNKKLFLFEFSSIFFLTALKFATTLSRNGTKFSLSWFFILSQHAYKCISQKRVKSTNWFFRFSLTHTIAANSKKLHQSDAVASIKFISSLFNARTINVFFCLSRALGE